MAIYEDELQYPVMKSLSGRQDSSFTKCLYAFDLPQPLGLLLTLHHLVLACFPLAALLHRLAARAHLMEAAQQALDLRLHRCKGQSPVNLRSDEAELLLVALSATRKLPRVEV